LIEPARPTQRRRHARGLRQRRCDGAPLACGNHQRESIQHSWWDLEDALDFILPAIGCNMW